MPVAKLRKVGGSVMMPVPPAMLSQLHISAGASVALSVSDGQLIVTPQTRPSYTLAELLAQCDGSAPASEGDRDWIDAPAVGDELI
ncbi:AbrB/MazE/SpoVT family DNA-binding domain-containing protein [Insolitispirillum peregrinum]|uniref:Antitoxin ChpS n=1 Tax=Insolitispirillum peregrinum TaxID=80876 RepID=A0A1N7PMA7_9PROT|nr:antitoxin [Insolitispirillum peregrinum]SIT11764.1 antitoxin ChpS [Insolitispirillum peregrinum]